MLRSNPAKAVRAPRRRDPQVSYLREEEVRELLASCEGTWIHDFIFFAVHTWMRRGEILGLQWKDFDLKNRNLRVNQILQRIRCKGLHFKAPKSKAGRGPIAISDEVVRLLR